MKHFMLRRFAAVFVTTFLVACSGGESPTLGPTADGRASARQAATGLPKGALYVGVGLGEHSRVNVYANEPTGGWMPIAKITDHVQSPASMAIGKDELYVADLYANAVSIYNLAQGGIYVGSLTDISRPIAVAADDAGDVAVVNSREEKGNLMGVVTVYPLGSPFPYVIRKGMDEPKAVAFDKSRNLYVANLGDDTVKVYAPGGDTIVKSISNGVSLPTALAFLHGGLLLVANVGGLNVTGYSLETRGLILVVPTGDLAPSALAIDGRRMYIGAFSYTQSEVIDYDFFTQQKTKITEGVRSPKGLAVCAAGEVCVQNDRNVTVYQSDKLIQTIKEPSSPYSIVVDR